MISNFKKALIVVAACSPLLLSAQVKDSISTAAKIDSIYNFQKKMYSESKNSPLANKTVGFEFNVFRLLMIDKVPTVSGSVSLFNVNRHAEVVFPFYFQGQKESSDLIEFTVDCHYRYFLGNTQNGFYLSGFARYAYLKGTLGEDYLFGGAPVDNLKSDESKVGIGVGIGYRIFSYRGLYWGTSLSFGRYVVGKSDKFASGFLTVDDDEYIIDFELLKFGWAF